GQRDERNQTHVTGCAVFQTGFGGGLRKQSKVSSRGPAGASGNTNVGHNNDGGGALDFAGLDCVSSIRDFSDGRLEPLEHDVRRIDGALLVRRDRDDWVESDMDVLALIEDDDLPRFQSYSEVGGPDEAGTGGH